MNNIDESVLKTIQDAIVTVPGVVSFSNFNVKNTADLRTNKLEDAIEITDKENITRFKIHVIILTGVNIKDVMKEIQIRVKYELEKMTKFTIKYMVDVVVDDLA